MKNKLIVSCILGSLLMTSFGTRAATLAEIVQRITVAANTFGVNALNSNLSVAEQNKSLNNWNTVFLEAKKFIIANSTILGIRDSDLMRGLAGIEEGSMDLINTIKIIRGLSNRDDLQKQSRFLQSIKGDIKSATEELGVTTMYLSGKKEAKSLILSIGRFLENMTGRINQIVLQRIDQLPKPPSPPVLEP